MTNQNKTFRDASRAVSTTVSYAITLVITTLLVTGLLIAGGDFVGSQREQATLSELRVIGQQLAGDISAADRLARTSGPDGDVTLQRGLPERIAGSNYRINVRRLGTSNTSVLHLESDNPEEQTEVRVHSTKPVFTKSNLTGGEVEISYNSVREELVLRRPGPFVFQEAGGQVVIEAESFPEDYPGSQNASAHYWKAFNDTGASGKMAVQVEPDRGIETQDTLYGPRMEYEVNFQTTGDYSIWVRTKGSGGGSDSVHVALKESGSWKPGTFGGEGLGTSGGWDWTNSISDGGPAMVTVDERGTHTIAIWMREDGTKVDKIILANDSSYDPSSGSNPPESDWA